MILTPEKGPRHLGFSLVELMISIGILATSLLLVVGIFMTVTRASQKSLDLTAGTIIAESVLSRELYSIMGDDTTRAGFFAANDPSVPIVQGTERLNQTVFTYLIYANTVMGGEVGNRVKKVDTVVWWWNEGGSSVAGVRPGYGFLRSEVSRLVNENSKF